VSDVFEEVEESLRQDKFAQFLQKHAAWLIAGVVALLLAIGGYQGFNAWRLSQSRDTADRMTQAHALVEAGKFPEAEKALGEIANSGPAGYKAAALMELGAVRSSQGDNAGALKAYDQAAGVSPTAQFRDAAKLKAAYVAADLEDFAKLEARLKPMVDGGGPFSFQARELLGLQAAANGDTTRARSELEFLTLALDAPAGVRQRAQSALAVLGPAPESNGEPADAPKAAAPKAGDKQ
jgi:hypothetical protein